MEGRHLAGGGRHLNGCVGMEVRFLEEECWHPWDRDKSANAGYYNLCHNVSDYHLVTSPLNLLSYYIRSRPKIQFLLSSSESQNLTSKPKPKSYQVEPLVSQGQLAAVQIY